MTQQDRDPADREYRGVTYRRDRRRWRAQLCAGGQTIHLGYYDSAEEAAQAYDAAAKRLLGDRAHTNFPGQGSSEDVSIRTPRKTVTMAVKRQLGDRDLLTLVQQGTISERHAWILRRLFLDRPRATKAELARILDVHPNTISRTVQRLVSRLHLEP